ncbi:MAG: hypothetical protein CSA18_01135 [Deltaproteobacteria bacterium]|nr:MAG: hypothetical protein CSA18_01135 [Deltaproteobacteria bacterium]
MKPATPLLAVDAVIFDKKRILLIKRKNYPHGYALPGGFVDIGENVENAVRREVYEETGIKIKNEILIGVYSEPDRDPRGHCVSIAFFCIPENKKIIPRGGDDALEAAFFPIDSLPENIVFDHKKIISDSVDMQNEI